MKNVMNLKYTDVYNYNIEKITAVKSSNPEYKY
jgi:hypothetical protein